MKFPIRTLLFASCAVGAMPAAAQDTDAPEEDDFGGEIIVTGVAGAANRLEASVSVSTVDPVEAFKLAPRSLGELYRSIPGVRSEPATGEGNGSIAVRGIPLTTGGYKFVQLQEDGLPVLQFGDIVAGNVPNYVRGDFTLGRIESIRGGSASTLATFAPGGIINHISKTGEEGDGGAIGLSGGLDFEEYRIDFDYGGELAQDLYFHVGGYYRTGEGARDVGTNANDGGQFKASLTKAFDNGYIRLSYKKLDDQIATYTRAPALADGNGNFSPIPGFDSRDQAVSSVNRGNTVRTDFLGNPTERDVSDHIVAKVDAIGLEASFDLGDGWELTNRFRTSDVRGSFIAPLALNFGEAGTIAADGFFGCDCNPSLAFANGPNAGQAVALDTLALGVLELDFLLDDLGLTVNDFRLSKESDVVTITGGLYYSSQNIEQRWNNWEYFIIEAVGDNAAGIEITDTATGEVVSGPGGVSGNAFLSNFIDFNYETLAPYLDVSVELDRLSLNASIRHDMTDVTGDAARAGSFFGTGVVARDVNGDGDTTDRLDQVAVAQAGVTDLFATADYNRNFTSFSLGVNYLVQDNLSVFARYSEGAVLVADRLWDGSNLGNNRVASANTGLERGLDEVRQAELGMKFRDGPFSFYATGFYTETDETQSEVTTQSSFTQTVEAYGVELEGAARFGDFSITGNFTWTDAEIIDASDPTTIGNTPNRQADYIFTLSPEYEVGPFSIGAAFVGSGGFFHGNAESVRQGAYILTHLFASYQATDQLSFAINANNVTNEFVNSFSESGIFDTPLGSANLAETLNGRTVAVSARYDF